MAGSNALVTTPSFPDVSGWPDLEKALLDGAIITGERQDASSGAPNYLVERLKPVQDITQDSLPPEPYLFALMLSAIGVYQ